MTIMLPLLAESSDQDNSLYLVLFLAFAIAAIVWLILWLFSDEGQETEEEGSKEAEAPADAADESEAETEPEPEKKEPEPKAAAKADDAVPDDFEAASEEEAAKLFADELSSGKVEQDPIYGIVYREAPDEVDDLKRIKGIAKVLEGKLHGIGVYQFRQVAVWTPAACQEFSKLLTFKDRIYRDNWIAQAKDFHEEKYGEKLP